MRQAGFSILVRIDLLLGLHLPQFHRPLHPVSVSSCGSTYCWGAPGTAPSFDASTFQYPRADRLIVGAQPGGADPRPPACFSILVRIDLLLGHRDAEHPQVASEFQYPRADRLIVGVKVLDASKPIIILFQYPRADRLIVGDAAAVTD